LKQELNCVVIELESTKEIVKMLREKLDNAEMEVRNSVDIIHSMYNVSDLPDSKRTRFQVQTNQHSEKIDMLKDSGTVSPKQWRLVAKISGDAAPENV
jgi:uncharacterized protein with ATP-grasp and redox domains